MNLYTVGILECLTVRPVVKGNLDYRSEPCLHATVDLVPRCLSLLKDLMWRTMHQQAALMAETCNSLAYYCTILTTDPGCEFTLI